MITIGKITDDDWQLRNNYFKVSDFRMGNPVMQAFTDDDDDDDWCASIKQICCTVDGEVLNCHDGSLDPFYELPEANTSLLFLYDPRAQRRFIKIDKDGHGGVFEIEYKYEFA